MNLEEMSQGSQIGRSAVAGDNRNVFSAEQRHFEKREGTRLSTTNQEGSRRNNASSSTCELYAFPLSVHVVNSYIQLQLYFDVLLLLAHLLVTTFSISTWKTLVGPHSRLWLRVSGA